MADPPPKRTAAGIVEGGCTTIPAGPYGAKRGIATADYHELRQRFVTALEAAARAQDSGELARIEVGYDELDRLLPRTGDPVFAKLHIALTFWDGWIDARNHDWQYYEGISKVDWPDLARVIVEDLRNDREVSDERVLGRFDLRRPGPPSVWTRLRRWLGRAG